MSLNTKNSPVQISTPLTDYPVCYEMTLAWSTKVYSIKETWDAIEALPRQLNNWLKERPEVERTVFCTEYTKKFHPHVHIAIMCSDDLPVDFRHGLSAGLRRLHRECRITFSQVVSKPAFNDYLEKDLGTNFSKYDINHKKEYDFN